MKLLSTAFAGSLLVAMSLATAGFASEPEGALNFVNDVVPILTKAACNSGGCHAKAGNGQNGFRLSLLGFEPQEDYEHIVKEGHGRRVFPGSPRAESVALEGFQHRAARRRQAAGFELGGLQAARCMDQPGHAVWRSDTDPKLASIEVQPKRNAMKSNGEQQLKVLAHYSDDSTRDVTCNRAL